MLKNRLFHIYSNIKKKGISYSTSRISFHSTHSFSYKLIGARGRLTSSVVHVFSFAFKTAIIWQTTTCSLMSKPSKQLMGNSARLPCGEIPMHEVHFLEILHAGCYLRGHVNQCAETATRRTGSVTL